MNLYRYQCEGAAWLVRQRNAILADEPGLGKTAQAIAAACEVAGPRGYIHVVCPAGLIVNWRREIAAFSAGDARWFIESFDMAAKHGGYDRAIDVLIIDEAHYLKNRNAKRTKAIYGAKCDGIGGLVSQAGRVYLLTGTPAPNNPAELWTHLRALFPEAILSRKTGKPMPYYKFESSYCKTWMDIAGHKHICGSYNTRDLRDRLAPHLMRRRKKNVLTELPPIRVSELPLVVSLQQLRDIAVASNAAGFSDLPEDFGIGDLARITDHVATLRRLTGLIKVAPIVQWVRDWIEEGGGKIVLFAHHRAVIDELAKAFPLAARVDGATKDKQGEVDRFQTDAACPVFLGQIQAAGVGVTLTAASTLVFVESSWSPSDNEQAAMRIHRIGQENACDIRFAHIAGSIDERIQRVCMNKTEMTGSLLMAG